MLNKINFCLLLVACCLALQLSAQNCPVPQAAVDLSANNIRARINAAGDLFTDGFDGRFAYQPISTKPSTIFSAGLWMGGLDPAGNLKLAAVGYRTGKTDYFAGPLDPQTGEINSQSCSNWDRVFTVSRDRIQSFLADLPNLAANPQLAIAQFPEIMGWPGAYNPYFSTINGFDLPAQELAPYFDVNNDANYNPLQGDYPAVFLQGKAPFIPAQIAWCVFNDVGGPHSQSGGDALRMEIQLTAWAFEANSSVPFNNTIFTSHKLIHRGVENTEAFHVAVWADFDLGCHLDDYIGCDSVKNSFYAYNQDAVDGNSGAACEGNIPTFGTETPVQTGTFLNRSMARFIYTNNFGSPGTTDPMQEIEYYHYLSGRWRDDAPLTIGGSGYNPGSTDLTNYAFPSDPSDPGGWSMCTANLPFGDRRILASTDFGTLQPGAINELTMAWTLHPNIPGPCNIGNAMNEVDVIQEAYNNGFTNVTSGVGASLPGTNRVKVSPNPASDVLTLDYKGLLVQRIQVYDVQGRLMLSLQHPGTDRQELKVAALPAGTYIAQLQTEQGLSAVRFVVER